MKLTRESTLQIMGENSAIWYSRLPVGSMIQYKSGKITILDPDKNPMLETVLSENSRVLLDGKELKEEKKSNG